eukprot:CAMPEP_0184273570 /NCGR_PEP_ID=MMETSP0977-20130417/43798_1 /TAXON_ID=483370 /ORGANISM="non described non described, Strain CCMP2097" /LENGTH=56 /DNA_ID=CAMNT_0026579439 /DNA_START=68 /DNA_END=235 /DNA_ORIENTATION=+
MAVVDDVEKFEESFFASESWSKACVSLTARAAHLNTAARTASMRSSKSTTATMPRR